ncbi:MAG: hypothetical protein Q8P79_01040 [Nanoarchaeota archaeon]|nr:hypothetical protein [Nanoarchaeota archaeon]
MAETGGNFKNIIGRYGAVNAYLKQISKMPLEDRLDELAKLKQRRKGFERGLDIIGTRILLLEHMPDIAVERVKRDEISMRLLQDLREKGDISYRDLTRSRDISYSAVVYNRLHLLKTAELIEMPADPNFSWDNIIKLTERGRSLQYAEPTK